jgi:hypothetical protein
LVADDRHAETLRNDRLLLLETVRKGTKKRKGKVRNEDRNRE